MFLILGKESLRFHQILKEGTKGPRLGSHQEKQRSAEPFVKSSFGMKISLGADQRRDEDAWKPEARLPGTPAGSGLQPSSLALSKVSSRQSSALLQPCPTDLPAISRRLRQYALQAPHSPPGPC